MNTEKAIILFDGICNYCNAHVNIVLKADKHDRFRFAPLQSGAGQAVISQLRIDTNNHDSFIFIKNGTYKFYTDAAIGVFNELGGGWHILAFLLALVPRFLRDAVYKWIARNRYKFFGKKDVCRVPTEEEKFKFL